MNEFEEARLHNEWLGGFVQVVKEDFDKLEQEIEQIKQEIAKHKEMTHDNNREKIIEKLT